MQILVNDHKIKDRLEGLESAKFGYLLQITYFWTIISGSR